MNTFISWFFLLSLIFFSTPVHAGGAALQRRQPTSQDIPPDIREQIRERARVRREAQMRSQQIRTPPVRLNVRSPERPPPPEPEPEPYIPPNKVLTSSAPVPAAAQPASGDVMPPGRRQELVELFQIFDQSGEFWTELQDSSLKASLISGYIHLYQQFGVVINKPVSHYVSLIDSLAQDNPALLRQPLDQVLRVVAIIEYDYDDGQDKDMLAESVLGDDGVLANKRRLGIE